MLKEQLGFEPDDKAEFFVMVSIENKA